MMKKNNPTPNYFIDVVLITMYSKCGSLHEAETYFKTIQQHNIFTYTAMMQAYTKNRHSTAALEIFHQILQKGLTPDEATFVVALKTACHLSSSIQGKQIHQMMKMNNIKPSLNSNSALIKMYGKCRLLDEAKTIFETIQPHLITHTAMMNAYTKNGHWKEALKLFHQLQENGLTPDETTFFVAQIASGSLSSASQGKKISN